MKNHIKFNAKILSKTLVFRVLILFFSLISLSAFAQQNMWKNIDNEISLLGPKQINPDKFRVLKLDVSMLQSLLSKTPLESSSGANSANMILEIPMPDGGYESFVVVESPMMEAELAKKFPEIKTYAGYSLKNPATTARFDFTSKGFHAMVLSQEGTFFIDPYNTTTIEYYIAYDKKDFTSKKSFSCGLDQIKQPSIDTPNDQNPKNKKDTGQLINAAMGDGAIRHYRLALAATGEYTAFHGGTVSGALAAQVTTMNRVNGIFLRDIGVKMNIIANNDLIIYTNGLTDPYTNDDGSTMLDENIDNLSTVIGNANFDVGHVFSTGGGGIANLRGPCGNFKAGGVTGLPTPVGDVFSVDYVAHEMGHQFGANHTQNNYCQRNSATAFEPGSASTIMGYAGICSPNIQNNSDDYFHAGSLDEMHIFITGTGNTCSTKPANTNVKPSILSSTVSQTIPMGTPFMLSGTATDANGNSSLTYCWEQMDNQKSTQAPLSTSTIGPNFRSFSPSVSGTRYFPRLSDLVANVSPVWEVLPTVGRSFKFRLVVRDNATGGGANDATDITLTVSGTAGPLVVSKPSETGLSYTGLSTQTVTWNVANTDIAPVSCANVDILLSTDGGMTYPTILASNVANNGSAMVTMPALNTSTARIMVKGTGRAFFDISNNNFSINGCTVPNPPTAVSVSATTICIGNSISLYATCSTGNATWYNMATNGAVLGTGTNFNQTPTSNTTYYVACENGTCKSSRVAMSLVNVIQTSLNIATNISTGTILKQATQTITASNKILSPAKVTYKAGNAIALNNGFETQNGSVFSTQIGGCP